MSRSAALEALTTMRSAFLPLASLLVLPVALVGACNAQIAQVLSSDDAGSDGGPGNTPASCTADHLCNADPEVSTTYGRCVNGSCVCNANTVLTATGKCAVPGTTTDAGPDAPVPACEDKGGICTSAELPDPPGRRRAREGEAKCADAQSTCWLATGGTVPVCYNAQGCNGNNAISAQMGDCNYGICFCREGFTVQTDGRCNVAPPPSCQAQQGTCRTNNCMANELMSANTTNVWCGDETEAFCCNAASTCTGGAQEAAGAGWAAVELECCSKTTGTKPTICVNGWQTCPSGSSPIRKGTTCN